MSLSEIVIRSKVIPPQPQRAIFHRPRLLARLEISRGYPLTLIHGEAGFGKTTALLELSGLYKKIFWYDITEPDRDPILFLAHLVTAFLPDSSALLERLDRGGNASAQAVFTALLNQLTLDLEEDAILILDDYHLVSDIPDISRWFNQLIENRPPRLSTAIACRKIPDTPAFVRWRVKGNLLVIDQSELSFTEDEIIPLFSNYYGFHITAEQAQKIFSYTDGWIIALQMIWQRLQSPQSKSLEQILAEMPSGFTEVFNFLAQEVLMRQPEEIQNFLISSAILRQMDANTCNSLLSITESAKILQQLHEKGLFISSVNRTNYRYQRLFQDFLLNQVKIDQERLNELHINAASHYISANNYEEAIYHLIRGGETSAAADWIEKAGPGLLESGRLRTLANWIEDLDKFQLDRHPRIWLLLGDVKRLSSQFDEAINAYGQAEKIYSQRKDQLGRSTALRSKAQVYLDTIRPLKASSLLEEAISLLEPQEHPGEVAALLDQLAENKLNLGKPAEAQALHKEAGILRSESSPDEIYLEGRALLRTGQLQEAISLLESYQFSLENLQAEKRPQRFHREMPLLLSLIHLLLGNTEQGELFARRGIEIGKQLDSPFVEAVGQMRLGHAYQLYPHLPWRKDRLIKAKQCYERSIELVRPFNVMRVQVEPLWGLCRLYGYEGNLSDARRIADQAIEIADSSGDYWFVALLLDTMGISYALAGNFSEASDWLTLSASRFDLVGDTYGNSAANCAMIFNHWHNGSKQTALEQFARIAPQLKKHHADIILTRPTHNGMQDVLIFIPLLLSAYQNNIEQEWISTLLPFLDLERIDFHPGYNLSIRTMGQIEVWRGTDLVNPKDWQREKARHLFQFFINNRNKWFTREQLSDHLWPDLDPDASSQNLKVALNALNHALEPMREPGQTPFFIARRESLYGINPSAQISMDVDDFRDLSSGDTIEELQDALNIYRGEYLSETPDEVRARETREELRDTFLLTAHRLADLYMEADRWEEVLKIGHGILTVDPCNESAFCLLMHCHAARGNRSAINSVYQRCAATLKEDLDVEPSPETTRLWKELTR